MAIASLVIHVNPDDLQKLMLQLRSSGILTEYQKASPDKIAAILESGADKLLRKLETIEKMPGVLNLEIAFINYEDDLGEDGFMNCPDLSQIFSSQKKN